MLMDKLAAQGLDFFDRADLRCALRHPWCWPSNAASAARAREHGFEPPAPLRPGEVLLVSVSDPSMERAALWRLSRQSPALYDAVYPLGNEASFALDLARRIVTAHVPIVFTLKPLADQRWWATLIYKKGSRHDRWLDGASYGLSMLLAQASLLFEVPVPSNLAASATIGTDGKLGGVEGLREKVDIIARWAPGVTRFLVHASQAAMAREIAASIRDDLKIIGVRNASEAIDAVFPKLAEEPPPSWDFRRMARAVYELALDGRGILCWEPVVRAAALARARIPQHESAHVRALCAERIALRHRGHIPPPIDWETASELGRRDSRFMAHLVQAAADAGLDETTEYISRAQDCLPALDACDDRDLMLMGALGRALAMQREYGHARALLTNAVSAWLAMSEPEQASHALCELLRVCGILNDHAGAARAFAFASMIEPHCDPISRSYLLLAAGRAFVQLGRPADGLRRLEMIGPDTLARAYVRRSAARWRARALDALSRRSEADEVRRALANESHEDDVEYRFAQLDLARSTRRGVLAAVDAVRACAPQGIRWLVSEPLPADEPARTDEIARRLADEYPY